MCSQFTKLYTWVIDETHRRDGWVDSVCLDINRGVCQSPAKKTPMEDRTGGMGGIR